MDVSDFRDVMGVFHKHPDITHAIHLAYVMGPLVDENTSLSMRVNMLGMTHSSRRPCSASSPASYSPAAKPSRPLAKALWRSAGDEDDFCDPASHFTYAVMKLLNEHMGRRTSSARRQASCAAPAGGVRAWAQAQRRDVGGAFRVKPAIGEPVTLPFGARDARHVDLTRTTAPNNSPPRAQTASSRTSPTTTADSA